jgi:hypothetical protein
MVRRLRVTNVRVGFSRFYGTVESYACLPHMSGSPIEFLTITTPSQLQDVQKRNLDRFVLAGKRLLGPVPYMGGDLELEVGLFSVKSQDMLKPYLDLLTDLAKAAGVAVFSVAAPYIQPLKRGIELLTGADVGATLEIGVAATFEAPREGDYYVARLESTGHNLSRFSLDDNYNLLDDSGNDVTNSPYIVFSIEQDPTRDDWFMIPTIAQSYAQLTDAVKNQKSFKEVTSHLEHVKRTVLLSPDLLPEHAKQVTDWIGDQVAFSLQATPTAGGHATELPSLEQLHLAPAV